MIKIKVTKNDITVLGHAMYDDYGKDIVCAAVSSVITTSVEIAASFDASSVDIIEENDKLEMYLMDEKGKIYSFDYVNNKILFNQKLITEDSVSLVYDTFVSKYKIPFTFNGRELYGYLDTGCYCTSIGQRLDEEKDENGIYIVKDFAIGNVHYEKDVLSNVREGRIVDSSRHFITTNNMLGYPCFKDHIIQLDFKNNVFRIK